MLALPAVINSMKGIASILLALSLHLLMGQEEKQVQNEFFNLSLEIPADWKLQTQGNIIWTTGPKPENIQITYVEDTDESLEGYFQKTVKDLTGSGDFEMVNWGSEEINGQFYYWLEHESEHQGVEFHDFLYMTLVDGRVYSITLTSTKPRYQTHGKELFEILRSIVIVPSE